MRTSALRRRGLVDLGRGRGRARHALDGGQVQIRHLLQPQPAHAVAELLAVPVGIGVVPSHGEHTARRDGHLPRYGQPTGVVFG